MKTGILRISFLVVFTINVNNINCTSLTESNGTAAKDIDGKVLLNLGRELNKPMLTLVAMAIRNLENLHPCDDWTQWSKCGTVRRGYIATRIRTRSCVISPFSPERENKTTETDICVCEGFCPLDYNFTENGFCVKLYDMRKSFDEAEKQCQKDGGHLINIDSDLKDRDVTIILQGFNANVFIDGRREDSSSQWLIENGSQKKFFNWASGEPNSYLCIKKHPSNTYWHDSTCTASRPFLCEILH